MRTTYDVEMMRQVGSCSGIENYSMHIDGRSRGSAPNCLLDYFPEDFLLVVDESHVAVPQIGGTKTDGSSGQQSHVLLLTPKVITATRATARTTRDKKEKAPQ